MKASKFDHKLNRSKSSLNFVELETSSMLPAKFHIHRTSGSIYGLGGHLGHVIWTIYINLCSLFARRLHMKFGIDWPSSFREDV